MVEIPKTLGLAFHTGEVRTGVGNLVLKREHVACLIVTTGKIVARDALILLETAPFTVCVPRGRFPVVLTLIRLPGEEEPRPTHATLVIDEITPHSWELALRAGEDSSSLAPGEAFGYPVDSWHGALMDEEASLAQGRFNAAHQDPDLLRKEHKAHNGLWNVHSFPDTSANVVTFFSGLGSGVYSSWFGRNGAGKVVCLTTDFQVFEQLELRPRKHR